jgi:hypothetical protein
MGILSPISEMLLLTSDWPCCHHPLDILLADNRHLLVCPFTHLFTGFLFLLYELHGFEDPPLGIPVAAWTCWFSIIAVTTRFLHRICPTPSPLTSPCSLGLGRSTFLSADSTTTMDSLDGPRASVSSVHMGSSSATLGCCLSPTFLVVVPRCLVTRSPFLVHVPPTGNLPETFRSDTSYQIYYII